MDSDFHLDLILSMGWVGLNFKSVISFDLDLNFAFDLKLFMGWDRFQICETLWILFWSWIHFRLQFGSDFGFVFFCLDLDSLFFSNLNRQICQFL